MKRFLLHNSVEEKFTLPASPWSSGFHERLIRSVKFPLSKILRKPLLSYEELETMLCQTEFIINSRRLM